MRQVFASRLACVVLFLTLAAFLHQVRPAVAQQAFDPAAATDAYLAQVSAADSARSDAYFEGGYWLLLWGMLYSVGVFWLLLARGRSARMRELAERLSSKPWLQPGIYAALFVIAVTLLQFPASVYTGYVREHQYGLATQTFGPWLGDRLTGLAVTLVVAPLGLMVLYAVFRRAPRTWWAWGAGVALVFVVLLMLLAPVYISPLFNTYTKVTDPAVRDPILSMARANGVPADDVFQFDASQQSTRISANVSGLGATMRVSLNDNLLRRTSLPEIGAVMGHELGHYVLNHVYEGMLFFTVVIVAGFLFLRLTFEGVRNRWGTGWGVRGIADPAGLPLLAALLAVFGFVLTPLTNTYVRTNEAEADIFGLNAARQPDGFAEVALKLGEYRKLDPGPWEERLFFDHPSGRSRIRMAMSWKAEHLHELATTGAEPEAAPLSAVDPSAVAEPLDAESEAFESARDQPPPGSPGGS